MCLLHPAGHKYKCILLLHPAWHMWVWLPLLTALHTQHDTCVWLALHRLLFTPNMRHVCDYPCTDCSSHTWHMWVWLPLLTALHTQHDACVWLALHRLLFTPNMRHVCNYPCTDCSSLDMTDDYDYPWSLLFILNMTQVCMTTLGQTALHTQHETCECDYLCTDCSSQPTWHKYVWLPLVTALYTQHDTSVYGWLPMLRKCSSHPPNMTQ